MVLVVLFCGESDKIRLIKSLLRVIHSEYGTYQVLGHITSLKSLQAQLGSLKRQMSELKQPRLIIFLDEDFNLFEREAIKRKLYIHFSDAEVIKNAKKLELALEQVII